jgi:hypothetical protein
MKHPTPGRLFLLSCKGSLQRVQDTLRFAASAGFAA